MDYVVTILKSVLDFYYFEKRLTPNIQSIGSNSRFDELFDEFTFVNFIKFTISSLYKY